MRVRAVLRGDADDSSIEDGGEKLLMWGDIAHSTRLQLAYPSWNIGFDFDKAQAVATREKLLEQRSAGGDPDRVRDPQRAAVEDAPAAWG